MLTSKSLKSIFYFIHEGFLIMPKYDYKCNDENCGEIFEVTQSFSDEPIANCIVCGNSSKRLISRVAVHFKGSGWYSTDNRSKVNSDNNAKSKKDTNKIKDKGSKAKKTDSTKKTTPNKSSVKKPSNSSTKKK